MRREMRALNRRGGDDRGATIVLLGLVLVVLMIFAAFSIDIGTAYAQRRQNQGTVDPAAVAGGVYFLYKGGNFKAMVEEVKDRVASDMGSKFGSEAWETCTDPNALPTPSTDPAYAGDEGSPCISFERDPGTNALKMRVRLPDVASPTSFASVIGIDELTTHAVAEVNIGSPLGGAFPFYLYSGAPPGAWVCIINGPPGQSPGFCNNAPSGQFGTFNPYYYQTPSCEPGGTNNQYWNNSPAIATGIDHLLSRFIGDPDVVGLADQRINGGGNCTVLGPNAVQNSQGNLGTKAINKGLLTGDSQGGQSYRGRLDGGPFTNGGPDGDLNTAKMAGINIDNAPLWYFLLNDQPVNAPLECKVAAATDPKRDVGATSALQVSMGLTLGNGVAMYSTPELLMQACLNNWASLTQAGTEIGPIFDADIAKSRRAVSVPRYWAESQHSSFSDPYQIRDFVPTFITGEFQAQATVDDPKAAHWAGGSIENGDSWSGKWNGNQPILGVTAMYVPCGALPKTICTPVPSNANGNTNDNQFGGEVHGVTLTR